jgi:hypothetical protein
MPSKSVFLLTSRPKYPVPINPERMLANRVPTPRAVKNGEVPEQVVEYPKCLGGRIDPFTQLAPAQTENLVAHFTSPNSA